MINWWRSRTLRFRLAVWYALGGVVLLAGFATTLYVYVAARMAAPLDDQHRADLAVIQQRMRVDAQDRVLWDGVPVNLRAEWTTNDPWFELWDEQGNLVGRFWPFAEDRVALKPSPPARGRETISIFSVAPDIRLRALSVPYAVPGRSEEWMVRIMRIHQPAADALGAMRLIIFVTLPIIVALLVVGGYTITRRWLMPLDRMVAEANRITADDLSRRLPVVNPHDELGRLASVFNVTLDRLQASFDALDRFVADASHELRTPLTTLRSVGEVGLRRSRTVEEYREIIGSMLEEAQRLQLLIERLLELASAEGGAPVLQKSELQLDDYVRACVGELSILAEYKGQQLAVRADSCRVRTDSVLFRQALQNLIDNAIKYSPSDSTIDIAVRDEGPHVAVSVTDRGAGISAENRAQLMQRFFRPDRGRGRNSGGFGLGLSITKAYMRVLGGDLRYVPAEPHGSTFQLRLPKV
jgi:heavy metal sensor kinase